MKFNRHKCEKRRFIDSDSAREGRKSRPLSSDNIFFATGNNPLFSGSEDDEGGDNGYSGYSSAGISRAGSYAGSRQGSRPGSRGGSRGSSRQLSPSGSLTQITIETATAAAAQMAAQLRDPFAEALTAPEGVSEGKDGSAVPEFVSEAEIIGGGISNRNWGNVEDDGLRRFTKEGSYEGTKGHGKSAKWADDSVVVSVENVDFELPKNQGSKRGPRACCMRYSLCVMITALVLAVLGSGVIVAVAITGGDVSFLGLAKGDTAEVQAVTSVSDGGSAEAGADEAAAMQAASRRMLSELHGIGPAGGYVAEGGPSWQGWGVVMGYIVEVFFKSGRFLANPVKMVLPTGMRAAV